VALGDDADGVPQLPLRPRRAGQERGDRVDPRVVLGHGAVKHDVQVVAVEREDVLDAEAPPSSRRSLPTVIRKRASNSSRNARVAGRTAARSITSRTVSEGSRATRWSAAPSCSCMACATRAPASSPLTVHPRAEQPEQQADHGHRTNHDPKQVDLRNADVAARHAGRAAPEGARRRPVQPGVEVEHPAQPGRETRRPHRDPRVDPLERALERQVHPADRHLDRREIVLLAAVPHRHLAHPGGGAPRQHVDEQGDEDRHGHDDQRRPECQRPPVDAQHQTERTARQLGGCRDRGRSTTATASRSGASSANGTRPIATVSPASTACGTAIDPAPRRPAAAAPAQPGTRCRAAGRTAPA